MLVYRLLACCSVPQVGAAPNDNPEAAILVLAVVIAIQALLWAYGRDDAD